MSEKTTKLVSSIANIKPVECGCNKCVNMCKKAPCIGTIEEMVEIQKLYPDSILRTRIVVPEIKEWFKIEHLDILALEFDEVKKQCVMLDENNKCKLHDSGLKPSEGKLANCKVDYLEDNQLHPLRVILGEWAMMYKMLDNAIKDKGVDKNLIFKP